MKSATSVGIHFETKHIFLCQRPNPRQLDMLHIKDFTLFSVPSKGTCKGRTGGCGDNASNSCSKHLFSAHHVRKKDIHRQRATTESSIPGILDKKKNDTLTGNIQRSIRKGYCIRTLCF